MVHTCFIPEAQTRGRFAMIDLLSALVLQVQQFPIRPPSPAGGNLIGGLVGAVSILLVSVGVFYVLLKIGSLLDSLKGKL